jgi:erythromycin esterase-like protein
LKSWSLPLFACLCFAQARAQVQVDDQGIIDAAQLIRSEAAGHRLILLGEMHGTQQIPKLVGALVSAYAEQGPVLLGLEVHHSEQAALRRYLASDGGSGARSALEATPFWNVNGLQHDGRRNHETLDLIEQVRRLRVRGKEVDILAYDNPRNQIVDSQKRDKAMAVRLRSALAARPRGRLLVLAGNVHAMLERPSNAPPEMQTPMGVYLRDLDPYSVDITANGGESWACLQQCGPIAMPPSTQASRRVSGGVYSLEIVLPRFTVAHLIGAPSTLGK